MGAELPSCHSGVDGLLAAADAVPREAGSLPIMTVLLNIAQFH